MLEFALKTKAWKWIKRWKVQQLFLFFFFVQPQQNDKITIDDNLFF